jgi:hypothetical protein
MPRRNLAAISMAGAPLDWNSGVSSFVAALAVTGTTVHVGGFFNELDGSMRVNFGSVPAATLPP